METLTTNGLRKRIEDLLKTDKRLITEKGELNYTKIHDLAESLDTELITLLLKNETAKANFFKPILKSYVFEMNKFIEFLDFNSSNNSYSKYLGKEIGLYVGDELLVDKGEVVLNFPYKDCVLEGGQTTEEGMDPYYQYNSKEKKYEEKEEKRREIFYNEILARDEIDQLFEPKAFCHATRYTKNGENKFDNFLRDENGVIKDNLIIKGNNLLTLHSLYEQFEGKVKLIYIDPPYNTGSKNDTFAYNNTFKSSTWLTFMKNRLEISKELLTEDGCLIVAIDEHEHLNLYMLLKDIFRNYEIHCISIVQNPRGVQGTNFSYSNEFALFVIPKGKKSIIDRKLPEDEIEWSNLRNWGTESERTDAKNCFYPIIVDKKTLKIVSFGEVSKNDYHPDSINVEEQGLVYVYPIDPEGIERKWRYARQTVESIRNLLRARIKSNVIDIEIGKDFGQYKTVWVNKKYDANEYGTKIVKDLVPNCPFSFPKSLWNVYDCLYSVIGKDKSAIVLDFFGGSGTTAHALMEINKSDKGCRRYILCEQMDYIKTVTCKRVEEVIRRDKSDSSFVYLELAENNERAMEEITACKSYEELCQLFTKLCEKYFLHYNFHINIFAKKTIKEKEFIALPLKKQKEMFARMIDLNQLYVNKSDMEDKQFDLSKEDIRVTRQFYGDK